MSGFLVEDRGLKNRGVVSHTLSAASRSTVQVHIALAEARSGLAEAWSAAAAAAAAAGDAAAAAEAEAAAEAAMAGALAACDAAQRITREHTSASIVLAEVLTAASKMSGTRSAPLPPVLASAGAGDCLRRYAAHVTVSVCTSGCRAL